METQEPVSPRLLNPGVPFDLETICLKCLEKEPARRYQTAQELAGDLGRLLNDEPISARPVGRAEKVWRWGQRRPAIAALIALLHVVLAAGLGGILWQWRRAEDHARTAEREQQRAAAAADESQLQRVEDLLARDQAAIALTRLAQVARRDPSNHVAAARLVSALSQRSFALPITPPLRHDGAVTCAVFSPDASAWRRPPPTAPRACGMLCPVSPSVKSCATARLILEYPAKRVFPRLRRRRPSVPMASGAATR